MHYVKLRVAPWYLRSPCRVLPGNAKAFTFLVVLTLPLLTRNTVGNSNPLTTEYVYIHTFHSVFILKNLLLKGWRPHYRWWYFWKSIRKQFDHTLDYASPQGDGYHRQHRSQGKLHIRGCCPYHRVYEPPEIFHNDAILARATGIHLTLPALLRSWSYSQIYSTASPNSWEVTMRLPSSHRTACIRCPFPLRVGRNLRSSRRFWMRKDCDFSITF